MEKCNKSGKFPEALVYNDGTLLVRKKGPSFSVSFDLLKQKHLSADGSLFFSCFVFTSIYVHNIERVHRNIVTKLNLLENSVLEIDVIVFSFLEC